MAGKGAAMGAGIGMTQLGVFGGLAFLGAYLPFYIVNSRARQRQSAIIKSLPDAFDLITKEVMPRVRA